MTSQQTTSQHALACAAQLITETVMRLARRGVSGTNDGQFITRTTVASSALHTVSTVLEKGN